MSKYLIQNSIWWIETLNLGGIRQDTYPYGDKFFMKKYVTIKLMLTALAVSFSAYVHAQESESWPVNELSMAGSTSWWVYSSNLPDELKVGSEIINSETGTGVDGLECEVTELASKVGDLEQVWGG